MKLKRNYAAGAAAQDAGQDLCGGRYSSGPFNRPFERQLKNLLKINGQATTVESDEICSITRRLPHK